ncbi:PKD domain-containing protein [Halomicrococcus gelatinilyticus]|uniref:PKD domain-containing protein n=1 Tax=Halomicrococcus gelatinilyticus TaxID=1702103 RepID=UPI002E15A6B2
MRRGATAVALLVVASVVLSGLAVALPPGPPPGLPGDDLPDAPAADAGTFSVKQGDTCVPVEPFQGNQRVDEFYDYRTPYTNESSYRYSSFVPDRFTRENASSLFLYEGPDGVVSLVVVHDERAAREVRPLPRSAVTFRFDGLPDSGEWVLVDDTYDGRDDRFDRNRIDWRWGGSRTDGGVFRGLAGDFSLTIAPTFNEDAALYTPDRPTEPITSWAVVSGNASSPTRTELDMSEPVVVRSGGCGAPPDAALAAADGFVGEAVTLDASGTTDPDGDVERYRWDFDGDGSVERTTTGPTVEHTYDAAGTRDVNVTVVDDGGNAVTATATVDVHRPGAVAVTNATLSATTVAPGETVTVTATVENGGESARTVAANLTVGGEVVASERVEVPADGSERVTFTYSANETGERRLAVDGVGAGTLRVADSPGATTPGDGQGDGSLLDPATVLDHPRIGGAALLVALLTAAIISRRSDLT